MPAIRGTLTRNSIIRDRPYMDWPGPKRWKSRTTPSGRSGTGWRIPQPVEEGLIEALGEKDGNVLSAMMLGEKSEMDPDTKELYQASGIGHILAISGLHLSFIGIGAYRIFRRMTGSYTAGGIAGILLLVLYVMMIGFTVSAVRALVMFLFRVARI